MYCVIYTYIFVQVPCNTHLIWHFDILTFCSFVCPSQIKICYNSKPLEGFLTRLRSPHQHLVMFRNLYKAYLSCKRWVQFMKCHGYIYILYKFKTSNVLRSMVWNYARWKLHVCRRSVYIYIYHLCKYIHVVIILCIYMTLVLVYCVTQEERLQSRRSVTIWSGVDIHECEISFTLFCWFITMCRANPEKMKSWSSIEIANQWKGQHIILVCDLQCTNFYTGSLLMCKYILLMGFIAIAMWLYYVFQTQ